MIHADYTTIVPHPPARLYAYLSNPANERHWQSSCVDAELLGALPAPGCRYRIVFSFLGRRMPFTGEITHLEPEREYAFRVVEGPFHYEGRYSLRPHPDGTELHWQFAAEPGKFFGVVPVSLVRKVLLSQVEKDLANLAHLLAAGGNGAVPCGTPGHNIE